ncbi:S41 family peptidase [Thermodesulfobacteriota bacterium]
MNFNYKKVLLDVILIALIISGILLLNGNNGHVGADTSDVYKNIETFAEVLHQIEQNYVEPQDPQKLIYGAIKGMVQSLDPHSSFMTREEHKELLIETKGSFSGVGIEITLKDSVLTVVSPIEGTPADKAGIMAGDKIIQVDDKPTDGMTIMDAVKVIRGPKGSNVKLTIRREGEAEPIEFTVRRDVIPLRSVRKLMLTPEIGYIRISNFQSKTEQDLSKALDGLGKESKLKGLILDLRNNPGGLLSQAIKVSDLFLDSGMIVSTKGRNSSQNMEVFAKKNGKELHHPIIVLVNGGSASAAEIVAGALKDNKKALILGTRTFGKGSVQTILPLTDGSGLRLTTARYYTPSGQSIQLSGIVPDIELDFIPSKEGKGQKKPRFIREKDLRGAMENESSDIEKNNTKNDNNIAQRVKLILERDNQVRHAVQLLQTWNIFSSIEKGS